MRGTRQIAERRDGQVPHLPKAGLHAKLKAGAVKVLNLMTLGARLFAECLLLPGLRPPALVIAGDHDAYSTREVTAQLLAALPAPQALILPGVGHLPNLEAPLEFDAAVRAFARRASRSGAEPAA